MAETIEWNKINTGMGWNKYEGSSESFGPYVIEKEDTRCFSVWWGHFEIGEASTVQTAKRVAQAHCFGLSRTADPQTSPQTLARSSEL